MLLQIESDLRSNFSLNRISTKPLVFHLLPTPASHSSQFPRGQFCALCGHLEVKLVCSATSSILHPTKSDDVSHLLWSIFQFSLPLLVCAYIVSVTLILLHFQRGAEIHIHVQVPVSPREVILYHLFSEQRLLHYIQPPIRGCLSAFPVGCGFSEGSGLLVSPAPRREGMQ